MERRASPFDCSRDITMAAEGMEERVDDRTLFCTPAPLAASTVSRDSNRNRLLATMDSRGSFLDDMSRLSMQSVSAVDLTNQLKQLKFNTSSDHSPPDKAAAGDSGPNLIQFSGATDLGSADQETNKSDSTDVSSRSSMGLIPTDLLDDLSASILPLATPKVDPAREMKQREAESSLSTGKEQEVESSLSTGKEREAESSLSTGKEREAESSLSTCKEKTADSNDWSDNSKQDSKDLPWGRSHLETVKKRPQTFDGGREGAPLRSAAQGAAALFAGHLLDDVQEGEELDQSVYNVELGDEDLKQLDADVNFSDLEEDHLEEDRESGDEDFDFDEPMLGLPAREMEERGAEDGSHRPLGVGEKTLQTELAEAESRVGEGQESEEEGAGTNAPLISSSDFGLDSRYFRKTPMPFAGDGEDTEVASNRNSMTSTSQQRGAAEGEHLLTKLRRQFMSGDGSENEIDTEDELEDARKSLAMAARERGQGADEEDSDRSNLPLPVGLEDDKQSDGGNRSNKRSEQQQQQPQFSFTTRQSAEGDTAHSPVPWGGDGGGDGSSGGDSDGGSRRVQTRTSPPPFRYVSGSAETQNHPSVSTNQSTASISAGQDAGDQSGLQSKFFMPTSTTSMLQDSSAVSTPTLEGSTFNVEDIFKSGAEAPPGGSRGKQGNEARLDASGFNAEDVPENPFEGQFVGSFGSFGLGPEGDGSQTADSTADRSAETGTGNRDVSREKPETAQFTYQSLSANVSRSLDGLPAKASGPLDGLPANSSSSLDGLPAKGSGSLDGCLAKCSSSLDELPTKGNGSLDGLPAKGSGSLDELPAKGNGSLDGLPAKGSGSFDGPFRKPRAPALPKRKMDRKETMTVTSSSTDVWKNATLPGTEVSDEGDGQLEKELRELGIDIGDDNFQSAAAAQALLDADEKQFEEDHKFSEHHHLALAAEGLAWEGDESQFSGFLAGEEAPDNLEVSVGTYIAARTETLGTLGGDPNVPRPEFGKPLESPPRRPYPIKFMSPPSTASSILSVNSRTEGEGNEDEDRTMVAGDSTLHADGSGSPQKSPEPPPTVRVTQAAAEKGADAEATLREELSSLILDLTGGGDLSMEDALSMSSVFDFIKNHSYTKSSDFASAILKLSKAKKQQQGVRGGNRSGLVEESGEGARKPRQKPGDSKVLPSASVGGGAKAKSGDRLPSSSSSQPVRLSTASNSSSSSASGSSSFTSPRQRGSRLPVRVGASSSPREKRLEKSYSERNMNTAPSVGQLSKSRSQSVSQILSHTDLKDVDVRHSFDDSFTQKQQGTNRQSSHKPKTNTGMEILGQQQSGVASEGSRVSVSKVGSSGDSLQTFNRHLSTGRQSQDSLRPDTDSRKRSGQALSGRDAKVDARMKSSTDPSQSHSRSSNNRFAGQEQSKSALPQYTDVNMNDSRDTRKSKSFSAEATKRLQDMPLNIPTSAQKGQVPTGTSMKENYPLQEENSASNGMHPSSTEAGYPHDSWRSVLQNSPLQYTMQTPPQLLPATTQHSAAPGVSHAQEAFNPPQLNNAPSSQTSPPGHHYNNHVPDGMETLGPPSGRSGSSPGASRAQAVGRENGGLVESRPLDFVSKGEDGRKGKSQPASTTQGPPSQARSASPPEALQEPGSKPTLLTNASLLRTEFAQKYLISKDASRPARVTSLQPADHYADHRSATRILPDHLHPGAGDRAQQPSGWQNASLQLGPSGHHPYGQIPASLPHGTDQRPLPPNATLQTLDESAMSVYYELNEDLHQTTMLGGESSVLGSFWGKSPLYQSTPAFEVAKVAAVSLMGSRLDEHDLMTPTTEMVTPKIQRQLIDIPRAVDFPEFCCLGVSQKTSFPVTNRSAFSVACRFRLVQLLHNGSVVRLDQQSPFELKPKMSISAGSSESLPVLFVPKRPGEHVCQIEVIAQSMNPTLEPTSSVLQVRAIAEVPHIQISPSVEVLKFGEVMWGGCASRTIKLRNIKRASLPVRLSIWSASSVWHCFTFDSCDNTSDMSIISMSSRPESLGRNVTTVILPGCDSPDSAKTVEIHLYCRPPNKELNRALAERPADKVEAKVDVEVDTPVQYLPPLASLLLRATVGMPRLLIPPSHMSLTFKTEPNKNIQESVLVNNSGNISMDLVLSVTTFPECFKVSPQRLTIKPGSRAEVVIIFSPLESEVYRYQSLLLLDVDPEGPSYEIPMEAQVSHPATRSSAPSILSSKSYLSFNGVPLNQTKSLNVRLYNKDSSKAEHACVEVRQSYDCFKLVSSSGEWQQKCQVVIEPKQKVSLTVVFCPTAVRGYSGKLVIRKQDMQPCKYSIPLAGYGGRSVLALSGACLTNSGQRWLELGALSVGHNIMREIVLTNSGVRAAFVKATAFYDMPCRQPAQPGRIAVEPNNFVLAAGCSTKVVVAMSPSQREVDLVTDRKEVVAVVRFQHGDEVMRQKYQRACSREGSADPHTWQAAFRQQFANEVQDAVILEGRTIPDSPDDTSAFFHHLTCQCVALLAGPHPDRAAPSLSVSAVLQTAAQAESAPLPVRDRTSRHYREESRRYDLSGQFVMPSRPEPPDEGEWTIKPDFLSLTVGENNHKMLQLINFSRQPLGFELSWPPSSVVPEPKKGELKPRSSTSVEVWLHLAWQKRLSELPWRGEIVVTCNGKEKSVQVHIQNSKQPPLLALSSPHSSPTSLSSRSPRDTALTSTGRTLQLASTNIHFPNAKVNGVHESVLELTNTSTDPMHWKISPFAPPYVKGADSSNTVQRVGYSAFTITPSSADLLPQETMKVPVKLCPKTKGTFNQHWEVEYQTLATHKVAAQDKITTKISLTAEVSSKESLPSRKPTWDRVDQDKTSTTANRTPLQEKHCNSVERGGERAHSSVQELQLMNQEVTFTDTKVGQVTQVKIELKNSLDHNVDLEAEAPKPPFRIKHRSFKITKKRFLKYPIEFGPTAPGSFTDTMVFRAPALGKTFTVHLKGTGL